MPGNMLLIDGYAAVYRAFYAIKGLSTAEGIPTNALFGFIRMAEQLRDKVDPQYLAVVFDGGMPADRLSLVPEYKAQRPSRPDDLDRQLPYIDRYLQAASIPRIQMDGEEADDVLASIAKQYSDLCESVFIATGDKDLFQIIDDRIKMIKLSGGNEVMGPDEVREKTGVLPEQTVEWLALIGDSADNIDGVPGIGVKTAAKLISQFGSIDSLYANIAEVASEKHRSTLIEYRDIVSRNIAMVKLKLDLQAVTTLESLKIERPDAGELLRLFEECELESMAKKIREPELF